jgi:cytochrome c oxidase subunit IV
MSSRPPEPLLPFVIAWAVLLLLLGLSVLSAYCNIGIFHPIVNFGIALTQAALVFILFMKLRERPSLQWVFAAMGFFWLFVLFTLSAADYFTRQGFPSLGSAP